MLLPASLARTRSCYDNRALTSVCHGKLCRREYFRCITACQINVGESLKSHRSAHPWNLQTHTYGGDKQDNNQYETWIRTHDQRILILGWERDMYKEVRYTSALTVHFWFKKYIKHICLPPHILLIFGLKSTSSCFLLILSISWKGNNWILELDTWCSCMGNLKG